MIHSAHANDKNVVHHNVAISTLQRSDKHDYHDSVAINTLHAVATLVIQEM